MSKNWENTVLDDDLNKSSDLYKKHLKGIGYYILALIFFVVLPWGITELFSPNEFAVFMNYPSKSYSYVTVFSMFGIAGFLGLVVLVKLVLYLKNKRKYS